MKETIGLPDRNYGLPPLHHRVNIPFYAHCLFGHALEHLLQLPVLSDGMHRFLAVFLHVISLDEFSGN